MHAPLTGIFSRSVIFAAAIFAVRFAAAGAL